MTSTSPNLPTAKTVAILLASGLSRRYRRHDKLLADLGGRPVVDHAARRLESVDFLARIAVCSGESSKVQDLLAGRFIIAPNATPRDGMGHSIAVGVSVAMQFKPESVLVCLGDMPFLEAASIRRLAELLAENPDVNVVHAGSQEGMRSPAIFREPCFSQLRSLRGEHGARGMMRNLGDQAVGACLSEPELFDIDTISDLGLAREQLAIRDRYLGR